MSNHKAGENPARRIPKVSHEMSISVGLVGPKVRPKGVADGQQVNIPALSVDRPNEEVDSSSGLCFSHSRLQDIGVMGGRNMSDGKDASELGEA